MGQENLKEAILDLKPTEEQHAIVEVVRDLAVNEIRPDAREFEGAGRVPDAIVKQLFEMGISTPTPEEFGGQGIFDAVTSVMIAEEIAFGDPGVAFSVLWAGAAATVIDIAGSDSERAELLPQLADGARASVALAERDAGTDITELEVSASEEGTLSGRKYAVVNADLASIRLVAASGPTLWLLDTESEPLARPEDKMGLRSARTFKVDYNGVPATPFGRDVDAVRVALLRVKLLNAGIALGLSRAALEYATQYARERTAFGRPIGAFQGISFKIADRAMDLETARLITLKAAWAVDNLRPDADRLVMAACGHAAAAAVANADDGVQILGGHGYMRDHPEEMWYRDALTLATLESASMIGDIFLSKAYQLVGAGSQRNGGA